MEEKTYAVVGRVEIGTDEYRDLITQNCDLRSELSQKQTDYWRERSRASEAETRLKEISSKYEELVEFIKADDAVATKLKLYRLEKSNKEEV